MTGASRRASARFSGTFVDVIADAAVRATRSPTDPTRPTTSLARVPVWTRDVPTTLGGCLPGAAHVFCLTCVESGPVGHRVPHSASRAAGGAVLRRPGRHLATTPDDAENARANLHGRRRRRRRGDRSGVGAGGAAVRGMRLGEDEATMLLGRRMRRRETHGALRPTAARGSVRALVLSRVRRRLRRRGR